MEMNSTLINHLNALGCASSLTSFFVFFFFLREKWKTGAFSRVYEAYWKNSVKLYGVCETSKDLVNYFQL